MVGSEDLELIQETQFHIMVYMALVFLGFKSISPQYGRENEGITKKIF